MAWIDEDPAIQAGDRPINVRLARAVWEETKTGRGVSRGPIDSKDHPAQNDLRVSFVVVILTHG
jgi:hypothetical protein